MAKLFYSIGENETASIELPVDLIYNLDRTHSQTITDLPLESGRNVSDNATMAPLRVRLQGIVSNMIVAPGRNQEQPHQTWMILEEMMKTKQLLSLSSRLRFHENLMIEQLDIPENVRTGSSLQFDMTLKQVDFVKLDVSAIVRTTVDPTSPAADRTTEVNKGVLNAEDAEN